MTRGGGSGAFGAGAVAGTIALESAGPGALALRRGAALLGNDRGESEFSAPLAPAAWRGLCSGQRALGSRAGVLDHASEPARACHVRARDLRAGRPRCALLRRWAANLKCRAGCCCSMTIARCALLGRTVVERAGCQPAAGRARGVAGRCAGLCPGARFLQCGDQRDLVPPHAGPAPHARDRAGRQARTAPAAGRRITTLRLGSTGGALVASCRRRPTAGSPASSPRGGVRAGSTTIWGCSPSMTGAWAAAADRQRARGSLVPARGPFPRSQRGGRGHHRHPLCRPRRVGQSAARRACC